MEAAVQSTVRCSISTKKSAEKTPRKLYSQIIEESKQLEHLNRKISKSNGRNIIKEISIFRKISPEPNYINPKLKYNPCNIDTKTIESLNIPLKPLRTSQVKQRFDRLFSKNLDEQQEFFDVKFKSCLWPEESVMDDKMFDMLNSQEVKRDFNIWVDIKPRFKHFQIKSRIGELEKNSGKGFRRAVSRMQQRVKIRSSSPWEYAGDCRSVVASPFISVSRS